MAWYWWLTALCGIGVMLFIAAMLDLFSKKPDFESEESEWESGSVNVKSINKAQHDIDANKLRDDFDREC